MHTIKFHLSAISKFHHKKKFKELLAYRIEIIIGQCTCRLFYLPALFAAFSKNITLEIILKMLKYKM